VSSSNNQEIYSGVEFSTWVDQEELFPSEQYLIQKYLAPNLRTVEAGTNSGRILFQIQKLGFTSLHGFDYVPTLIDVAIERDPTRSINFEVRDAIDLTYADGDFEQIIYLQQIICLIEQEADRLQALREAYRILKQGGTGLFSFLSFESRSSQPIYAAYLKYLATMRKLRQDNLSIQYLPWLILGGKFNINSILDRSPYVYWYRATEICQLLQSVGFEILAVGSDRQISVDLLNHVDLTCRPEDIGGMLYVVVKK
jgi:SAM-dependent methyltransferase